LKRTEFKAIKCALCGKEFLRITNTHLWKEHQITMEEYKKKFPKALVDAKGLAHSRVTHLRDVSYEEYYSVQKGTELQHSRKVSATKQMTDQAQIEIRKEKCGYFHTEEQKEKVSLAKTKTGSFSYRKRALKYYGLECQRCGYTSNDPADFIVHHKDFLNISSELGNYSVENLMVLCKSCHAKLHNEVSKVQGKFAGISNVEKGVHYILKGLRDELGLDLSDVNFRDTPKRVARAYAEIFGGVRNTQKQVTDILSTAFPSGGYDSVIFSPNIRSFSMCPHHFLPVEYKTAVGYIPSINGKVLGASKLGRIVEILSQRPVLQETLTKDIVSALETVNPQGVAVVVSGIHYCMRMRGIKQDTTFETSAMSGVFLDEQSARKEFFDLLLLSKYKKSNS